MTEEIRLTEGVMAEEIRVVEHYSASFSTRLEKEPAFWQRCVTRASTGI